MSFRRFQAILQAAPKPVFVAALLGVVLAAVGTASAGPGSVGPAETDLASVEPVGIQLADVEAGGARPAGSRPVAPAPQAGIRTVVIDPGHGGSETGAIGPVTGITEKNLALAIAGRLRDLILERLGIDVRLTRPDDRDMTLEERTAVANNLKADVFISIHANAYRGRGVRGAETFFLSATATDDEARRLAALENDTAGVRESSHGDSELQMLLWDMAQTLYLRESSVLAETIQKRLNELAGTSDRGIKQAPFRVLKGATMPAVLVEVGFLSNPDEEQRLADPGYQQDLAEALYRSLDEYRQRQAMLSGGGRR